MSDVGSPAPTAGLIDDSGDTPRLIGGRCGGCGRHCFPCGASCPWCGAPDPDPVRLSPTGTLWGWTAVTAAPPGYVGPVPYGFGVVELVEGLRVVTRLTEPDPSRLRFGQPMRLVTEAFETGAAGDGPVGSGESSSIWAFAPETGA